MWRRMVSDVILTHCVQDTARRLMLMLHLVMSLGTRNEARVVQVQVLGWKKHFELFICRVVKHTHSQCLR